MRADDELAWMWETLSRVAGDGPCIGSLRAATGLRAARGRSDNGKVSLCRCSQMCFFVAPARLAILKDRDRHHLPRAQPEKDLNGINYTWSVWIVRNRITFDPNPAGEQKHSCFEPDISASVRMSELVTSMGSHLYSRPPGLTSWTSEAAYNGLQ